MPPRAPLTVPVLPLGSQVTGGQGLISVGMDGGFLLVLIHEASAYVVAMHDRVPASTHEASEAIKPCLSWLRAVLSPLGDAQGPIRARLVAALSQNSIEKEAEQEAIEYLGHRITEWLRTFAVTMGPIRVFDGPRAIRLELTTGRLLTERGEVVTRVEPSSWQGRKGGA